MALVGLLFIYAFIAMCADVFLHIWVHPAVSDIVIELLITFGGIAVGVYIAQQRPQVDGGRWQGFTGRVGDIGDGQGDNLNIADPGQRDSHLIVVKADNRGGAGIADGAAASDWLIEAQHDGDTDKTGHHHQDGRYQAENGQQQEELQRGAVV